MKVYVNFLQFLFILEGDDVEIFNYVLQYVVYMNILCFVMFGVRFLCFIIVVKCFSEEFCVFIFEVEGYVVVFQFDVFQILLSGIVYFVCLVVDFEGMEGVFLFFDF